QSGEILRRYVDRIRYDIQACFLAIADAYASAIQRTLIRKTQTHSGVLHSWNLPHCRRALTEQFSKGRSIVVSQIVQRGLGGHNAIGIEPWQQGLEVNESSNQQA